MAFASEASRRFTMKLNALLDKVIIVRLTNGRTYKGKLSGFDQSSLSLALEAAVDNEEQNWPIAIIYGPSISEILVEESSIFSAKEFAEFLHRHGGIPPHQIRVYEDINVVEVARSVKVSKDGVEGSGALASRVNSLFREYMRRKGVRM
jgi:small nuclear ribonucleoprotein (snRNP)-like protein